MPGSQPINRHNSGLKPRPLSSATTQKTLLAVIKRMVFGFRKPGLKFKFYTYWLLHNLSEPQFPHPSKETYNVTNLIGCENKMNKVVLGHRGCSIKQLYLVTEQACLETGHLPLRSSSCTSLPAEGLLEMGWSCPICCNRGHHNWLPQPLFQHPSVTSRGNPWDIFHLR